MSKSELSAEELERYRKAAEVDPIEAILEDNDPSWRMVKRLIGHINYLEQDNRILRNQAAQMAETIVQKDKRIAALTSALQIIAATGMGLYENRVAEEALVRLKSDR